MAKHEQRNTSWRSWKDLLLPNNVCDEYCCPKIKDRHQIHNQERYHDTKNDTPSTSRRKNSRVSIRSGPDYDQYSDQTVPKSPFNTNFDNNLSDDTKKNPFDNCSKTCKPLKGNLVYKKCGLLEMTRNNKVKVENATFITPHNSNLIIHHDIKEQNEIVPKVYVDNYTSPIFSKDATNNFPEKIKNQVQNQSVKYPETKNNKFGSLSNNGFIEPSVSQNYTTTYNDAYNGNNTEDLKMPFGLHDINKALKSQKHCYKAYQSDNNSSFEISDGSSSDDSHTSTYKNAYTNPYKALTLSPTPQSEYIVQKFEDKSVQSPLYISETTNTELNRPSTSSSCNTTNEYVTCKKCNTCAVPVDSKGIKNAENTDASTTTHRNDYTGSLEILKLPIEYKKLDTSDNKTDGNGSTDANLSSLRQCDPLCELSRPVNFESGVQLHTSEPNKTSSAVEESVYCDFNNLDNDEYIEIQDFVPNNRQKDNSCSYKTIPLALNKDVNSDAKSCIPRQCDSLCELSRPDYVERGVQLNDPEPQKSSSALEVSCDTNDLGNDENKDTNIDTTAKNTRQCDPSCDYFKPANIVHDVVPLNASEPYKTLFTVEESSCSDFHNLKNSDFLYSNNTTAKSYKSELNDVYDTWSFITIKNSNNAIFKEVNKWMHNIPMYNAIESKDIDYYNNLISNFVKQLNMLSCDAGSLDYEEKLKIEINIFLDKIPFWNPGAKREQTRFKRNLIDQLYIKLKALNRKNTAVGNYLVTEGVHTSLSICKLAFRNRSVPKDVEIRRCVIEWLQLVYSEADHVMDNQIFHLADSIVIRINPLLNVPVNTYNHKIILKSAIVNIINELPPTINFPINDEVEIYAFAKILADSLLNIQAKYFVNPTQAGSLTTSKSTNDFESDNKKEIEVFNEVRKCFKKANIDVKCKKLLVEETAVILLDCFQNFDHVATRDAKNEIINMLMISAHLPEDQALQLTKLLMKNARKLIIKKENGQDVFRKSHILGKPRKACTVLVCTFIEEANPLKYY